MQNSVCSRQEAGGTARPFPQPRRKERRRAHDLHLKRPPECVFKPRCTSSVALAPWGNSSAQVLLPRQQRDVWNESLRNVRCHAARSTPAAVSASPSIPPTAMPSILSSLRRLLGRFCDWRADVLVGLPPPPPEPGRGGSRSVQGGSSSVPPT